MSIAAYNFVGSHKQMFLSRSEISFLMAARLSQNGLEVFQKISYQLSSLLNGY